MAVLTPFHAAFGTSQGRVAPANAAPEVGERVFVLGSDEPGRVVRIAVGDFVEVEQVADVTGVVFLNARARVRVPTLPGDLAWTLSLVRFGDVERVIPLYRDLLLTDMAIHVGSLWTGDQRFGFRLELTGTPGTYDVELPAVYLDGLSVDDSSVGYEVFNRDPAPGEEGVPINRSIQLDLVDAAGALAVNPGHVSIYVGGVLAYAAGVFQPGFDGPESAEDATPWNSAGLRITIDPTAPFGSEQTVDVRVAAIGSPNGNLDVTYSFVTEDVAAPRLAAAVAIERRTVRATFSEPMVQLDPAAANDALNPANWTVEIASTTLDDGLPAVALEVVGVESDGSDEVLLELDVDATRGAVYRVTVENAEDPSGNAIGDPTNVAFFVGFECPQPAGRTFSLIDMVPDLNVAEDETGDLARFVAVIQEVVDLLLCDVDRWVEIIDVDLAPEPFVDAMLFDLGNPFEFDLTLIDKRRLARLLVPIYRQKGTADGIVNAIRFFLGIETTLVYPAFGDVWTLGVDLLGIGSFLGTSDAAARYSYRIVSPVLLTDEQRSQMLRIARYMHPAHEHVSIEEPPPPPTIPDHWELGYSELGTETILH